MLLEVAVISNGERLPHRKQLFSLQPISSFLNLKATRMKQHSTMTRTKLWRNIQNSVQRNQTTHQKPITNDEGRTVLFAKLQVVTKNSPRENLSLSVIQSPKETRSHKMTITQSTRINI